MRTIRASSAPLAMTCPGSQDTADTVKIDSVGEPAEIGTASHELAAEVVAFGDVTNFDEVMRRHAFDSDQESELRFLLSRAKRFWSEYSDFFPEPAVEIELKATFERWEATGHIDIGSGVQPAEDGEGVIVRVADWKSTRLEDVNYHAQMMMYLLLLGDSPKATRFQYVIAFLRDGSVVVSPVYRRSDLDDFRKEFEKRVLDWDGRSFTTGGHCRYCRRFHNCPAYREIVKTAASDLSGMTLTNGVPLAPAAVVDLAERCKALQGLIDRFREYARAMAYQSPGKRIPGGNGHDLALIGVEKANILPKEGWPVITKYLTHDEIAPCLKVRKTEMMDTLAKKAGKGNGARVKREFMGELEEAGAVEHKTEEQLRTVKSAPDGETKALPTE